MTRVSTPTIVPSSVSTVLTRAFFKKMCGECHWPAVGCTAPLCLSSCPLCSLHSFGPILAYIFFGFTSVLWTGIAWSIQRPATGWTVRGSNPGVSEIFRNRPDRLRGPPSLLYKGYRVSFLGIKLPGSGVAHPPHLTPRLKKKYSDTSTSPIDIYDLS